MTSEPSDVLNNLLLSECINTLDAIVNKLQFFPLKNHIEANTYFINNYSTELDI